MNVVWPTTPCLNETITARLYARWGDFDGLADRASYRYDIRLSNGEELLGSIHHKSEALAIESGEKILRYHGYKQRKVGPFWDRQLEWFRTGTINDVASSEYDRVSNALIELSELVEGLGSTDKRVANLVRFATRLKLERDS